MRIEDRYELDSNERVDMCLDDVQGYIDHITDIMFENAAEISRANIYKNWDSKGGRKQ